MDAIAASFYLRERSKVMTTRQIVEDALVVAATHAVGRINHNFHTEIVDEHDMGKYHHFNIVIDGEHSQSSQHWKGMVVKSDFFNVARVLPFQHHFSEQIARRDLRLHGMQVIYFHDQRKFGFSVILSKPEAK